MKKVKSFKVGDKVFAKVKGYPAWPAQIVSVNGKKYDVTFYGTGESGCLKPEDLFYYLKHKSQFAKTLKRKDYNDAIDQIESEISDAGTDGNLESAEDLDTTPSETSTESKRNGTGGGKRKRSSSSVTTDSEPMKITRKNSSQASPHEENNIQTDKIDEGTEKKGNIEVNKSSGVQEEAKDVEIKEASKEVKGKNDDSKEVANEEKLKEEEKESTGKEKGEEVQKDVDMNEKGFESMGADTDEKKNDEKSKDGTRSRLQEDDDETPSDKNPVKPEKKKTGKKDDAQYGIVVGEADLSSVPELENVLLIPDIYLTALTVYAQKVREKEDIFKVKSPDNGTLDNEVDEKKMKVVPAKLQSGKYVGIKFVPKYITEFTSEYDRAMDDEKLAKETLELKRELMLGKREINDDDDTFIQNLKCRENDIYQIVQQTIMNYKNAKMKILNVEHELHEQFILIKRCLGLDEAQPKSAISHLEFINGLPATAVMLKKNMHFVDTIKRLRRYVGNIQCWELDEEQIDAFGENAKKIRDLAEKVFEKFRSLFDYKDDEKFSEKFQEDCEIFEKETANLTEAQKWTLCAEPFSRKSLLDQIYNELSMSNKTMDNED